MDKIKKWLHLGAAIAGALALILGLFCPAVAIDFMGVKDSENGLNCMLGKDGGEFVFMMLLTVLLVVAAIACSVLAYLKPENKLFALIAAACFAVAAIFYFSTKGFYLTAHDAKEVADMFKLGIGSILAAILSILGAGAVAVPVILNK